MVFSVGETVVYPHHGAALIEAIETRVIKGEEKQYLVLRVAQGDLTVRVPAENAEIVGVREVVGEEGLTKVFDEVVGVLAEVERATDAGRWAFGYVAYEAAAGMPCCAAAAAMRSAGTDEQAG